LEHFETKEAKWSILALFDTVFWKLELLRKKLKPRKHSDAFRRMWSTTFSGAIGCRTMFITKITIIDYTIQRKLVGIELLFITSNIRFLNTPVYLQTLKDMTYSLNCISVLLFT